MAGRPPSGLKRASPDVGITHAGGVVFFARGERALFLLVRSSREPFDWVLPKGHIEQGETPEAAARREVLEEAGIAADIVAPLGDTSFDQRGRLIHVRYFLMKADGMVAAAAEREICWCGPADAERLLTFENARAMLRRAVQWRERIGSRGPARAGQARAARRGRPM